MLDKNDTKYFGVDSIMIYDPSLTNDNLQNQGKLISSWGHHMLWSKDPLLLIVF